MKYPRLTALALAAVASHLALAAAEPRENAVIENEHLRVQVDPAGNSFAIHHRSTGKDFAQAGTFAHPIKLVATRIVSDPCWGQGRELLVSHANGWNSSLRLFRDQPFLHVHTTTYNDGKQPDVAASLELLDFEVNLGRPPKQLKSFGTGFLSDVDEAPGSFTFAAVVDPATRNGVLAACVTHERGSGVFFTGVDEGKVHIKTRIDFGRYQVEPGQSRPTETLLIGYFDDTRLGLEAYADAVAKHYAIQLPPQPAVYCTWYHGGASDEKRLQQNARFAKAQLEPFGLSVMQIDDKWQKLIPEGVVFDGKEKDAKGGGPVKVFVESNDKYPSGMKYTADEMTKMGLVPGIWFMPFAGNWKNPYFADKQDLFARWSDNTVVVTRWSGSLLDMSNPKTQAFVANRVQRIADWGYRYFKLDGMHTGAVTHNVYVNTGYATSGRWLNTRNFVGDQEAGPGAADQATPSAVLHDPGMTHIEAYRKGLQIVREAAGPEVFILGCNVSQNMRSMGAAFGLIDSMRIGPDNGGAGSGRWGAVMVGARHGSNLYFLNRRVWHNDPDPVYVRASNPLNAARLMVSWVAVTGSMLTTSYQFAELPAERLDLLKRCMPSHQARARPVDLFESDPPAIWLTTDDRSHRRRNLIGLFNWNEKEPHEINCKMDRLGLDSETTYAAFDYWANEFAPPIRGTLEQTLPPGSCRILAVRSMADHPQLLSTSRHIAQGMVDVLEEHWEADTKTLSGRSRVVAGDPYELRIALPPSGSWKIARVSAERASIQVGDNTGNGVRLLIDSKDNRDVCWEVVF